MHGKLLAATGLVALSLALASPSEEPSSAEAIRTSSASDPRSFTFSADPSVRVLVVSYSGTTLMYRPVYSVYGDGRFVADRQSHSGEVLERFEAALSFEEVRSLLRIPVDHGLLDVSQAQLEQKISDDSERLAVIDGGQMMVAIHLLTYTTGEKTTGPVSQWISTDSPGRASSLDGAMPELKGFFLLQERLQEIRRRATRAEDTEVRR